MTAFKIPQDPLSPEGLSGVTEGFVTRGGIANNHVKTGTFPPWSKSCKGFAYCTAGCTSGVISSTSIHSS